MDYLQLRTRGNAKPEGKPRVYLTCHPEDVDGWLDATIADIHAANDCAVFFADDMASRFEGEDWELDLGRMQLFVVPVTFKLLSEPSRAMDVDIPFALERRIPVLPIVVEPDLDDLYVRCFGELQYLSPAGDGRGGGVAYDDRLGRYLESVLVGEEEAAHIRKAFDAYVFLSYRKADRRLADDLMRTVHADPRCRDIAIWYDEFLTPGESFRSNIDRALANSMLFVLLVTPNVVERPGGEPNFVMGVEYPAARNAGMEVVAVEAQETDRVELASGFDDLPEPYPLWDPGARERIIDTIARFATESNDDPLHTYLVGLAYLKGIDVEHDNARGVELVTSAAESGLPQAMEQLANMYHVGAGVELDYGKAAMWGERLYEHRKDALGGTHPNTLVALSDLGFLLHDCGDFQRSSELAEQVWHLRCEVLGETHQDTLTSLSNLATLLFDCGEQQGAVELADRAWRLRCEVLGETHPDTLTSLSNLAVIYGEMGDCRKAAELSEMAWRLRRSVLGEAHPDTLSSLTDLAASLSNAGDYARAEELARKAWLLSKEALGDAHASTLVSLSNLVFILGSLGEYQEAVELGGELWRLTAMSLGEAHPDTLTSLSALAYYSSRLGDHKRAAEFGEIVWLKRREVLGETHPRTLRALTNLADYKEGLGDSRGAQELRDEAARLAAMHP